MQRSVVVLRYWLGLSVAETAADLRISQGTVKSHAHRASSGSVRPFPCPTGNVRPSGPWAGHRLGAGTGRADSHHPVARCATIDIARSTVRLRPCAHRQVRRVARPPWERCPTGGNATFVSRSEWRFRPVSACDPSGPTPPSRTHGCFSNELPILHRTSRSGFLTQSSVQLPDVAGSWHALPCEAPKVRHRLSAG